MFQETSHPTPSEVTDSLWREIDRYREALDLLGRADPATPGLAQRLMLVAGTHGVVLERLTTELGLALLRERD
jgi:hypothetical protein